MVIKTENCEKKILKQVRHLKTSQMSEGNLSRRKTPAGLLRERFESNIHMIQKSVEQDEKISLLKFLSVCRTIVYMVKERNQIFLTKVYLVLQTRCAKKVMTSTAFSWYGVTKPFLIVYYGFTKRSFILELEKS